MKTVLQSRVGLVALGVLGLGLTYVLASLAIDTAHYWQYLGAIAAFFFSIKAFVKAAQKRA